MKAVTISAPGDPEVLELRDRPIPEPGPDQVRVRVLASALNRADLLQRRGFYPAPAGFPPEIPGLEYAGEVEAVGSAVRRWSGGDRVMGIIGGGAHAGFVCVHEREALPVPEGMAIEVAAAVPEAFLTAYDGLVLQLGIRIGESVLIHAAASGVGTAAVQLARLAGATTFGSSRTPEKLERLRALGLDHPVLTTRDDWSEAVESVAGPAGIDAILDLVGGRFHPINMRLLAERGRALIVGTLAGTQAELDLRLLLSKRLHLSGTVLRSRPLEEKIALARAFSGAVLPLLQTGRLRPVIDRTLPFSAIAEAHRQMETNNTFGKIVLVW